MTFILFRYAQQGNRSGSLEEPLEDKNLREQPEVRPENDKEIIFGTNIVLSTGSINLDCRVSTPGNDICIGDRQRTPKGNF
jgi:hypothetical protein